MRLLISHLECRIGVCKVQIWLIVVFAVLGAAVGILQVWLLSRLLPALTAKEYADAVLPLLLKTVVYAASFAVTALLFPDYLIPLGAGIGGGITVAAFVGAAVGIKKNK